MSADLAERFQGVKLLLSTLNDPYPTPRGALVSDSGPAPSFYVPCETCHKTGEVRVRSGWMLCLSCDGRGWRRRERREPPWDAYLGMRLDDAAQLPRASRARSTPAAVDDSFAWERAIATHDRHGSYKAVRAQLDWLGLVHPPRHRLVRAVLVEAQQREITRTIEREVDLGVLMITIRIPSVKVPPWLIEKPAKKETVETMLAAGFKPGEIARRLGISKRAIQRKMRAGPGGKIRPEPASRVRVLEAN